MNIPKNTLCYLGTFARYVKPGDSTSAQITHTTMMWLITVQSSIGGWTDCHLAET